MTDLTTEQRFKKAKIKLQSKNPFFSYLSLYLEEKEAKKKELPDWAGMGVNIKGELFYSKKFVDKISDDELMSVLVHEILHLSLLHLLRLNNRNREGWNIACDLVVNHILEQNNFHLPKDCVKPKYDYGGKTSSYIFEIGKKIIQKVEEKTAEQIYDELPKGFKIPSNRGYYIVMGGGDNNEKGKGTELKGFDEHILGEGLSKAQADKLKEEWENRISEAYINAKQRGDLPVGMERLIGKLHKEKIDWRTALRRFIVNEIPSDYSWCKPSKKSIACGYYLPDIVKEKVEIIIVIDTSGSVGQKELVDFLSEIIGMSKAYQDKIDMRLITCDCEIHEDLEVKNGNISKIKQLRGLGGGGTSFIRAIDYIKEKNYKPKCLVYLTDGYGDEIKKQNYDIIWVLSKNGSDELIKNKGKVIKLEDE